MTRLLTSLPLHDKLGIALPADAVIWAYYDDDKKRWLRFPAVFQLFVNNKLVNKDDTCIDDVDGEEWEVEQVFDNYGEFFILHGLDSPHFIMYKNAWYLIKHWIGYDDEKLLLQDAYKTYENKIERIRRSSNRNKDTIQRQYIPDDVQIFVWNRDGGRCCKCGSQENLEFDHIVPISLGGSNTARNIQILCEKCNREKSNKVGG